MSNIGFKISLRHLNKIVMVIKINKWCNWYSGSLIKKVSCWPLLPSLLRWDIIVLDYTVIFFHDLCRNY